MSEAGPLPPVAILAGGLAKRMRPITETIPKAMIEVAGEPFIAHQLRLLAREGASRVVLCLGYRSGQVQDFVGGGKAFGLEVTYSFDGDPLLGTGGAIRKALPLLGPTFFITYGDSYLDFAWGAAAAAFARERRLGLLTVFANADRWDTSNTIFRDGRVLAYSKKERNPEMRYIDYGAAILRAEALTPYASDAEFDLGEVYTELAANGELMGYEVRQRFYEIGSPQGLADLDAYLRSKTG
jgi:NDP-sugar pyrophosphorylase family protein